MAGVTVLAAVVGATGASPVPASRPAKVRIQHGSIDLSEVRALAVDPSGRIVAAGYGSHDFAVARYTDDGRLDRTFGHRGKVTSNIDRYGGYFQALVIDGRGRIVAAGVTNGRHPIFVLARYRPNGALDRSFGHEGATITGFGKGNFAFAGGVAVEASEIVVGGGTYAPNGTERFALAGYRSDGRLDRSFGSDGRVTTAVGSDNYGAGAGAVALDGQRQILLAGGTCCDQDLFALARYNPDGSLDSSFGAGGSVVTPPEGHFGVRSVAVDSEGRIVAAGAADPGEGSAPGVGLARYEPDGELDPAFGSGGTVVGGSPPASAAALDGAGNLVTVGEDLSCPYACTSRFALARYTPSGALDPSFGSGGRVISDFGLGGQGASPDAVALTPAGDIIAAGDLRYADQTVGDDIGNHQFLLARYRQDGSLDTSFGSDGVAVTPFPPSTVIEGSHISSRKGLASFRIRSDPYFHVRLQCSLARKPHRPRSFTACGTRGPGADFTVTHRRLRPGRYTLAVRAKNVVGHDLSPATRRFRIR